MIQSPRFTKLALVAFALILGSTSFADQTVPPSPTPIDETTVVPQRVAAPTQVEVVTPVPTEVPVVAAPALKPVPAVAPAPVCATKKEMLVFRVYERVDQCGTRIPNNGIRGRINARRVCGVEKEIGVKIAEPCTCEDCAAVEQVSRILCNRGECQCSNDAYVAALIEDLKSYSRRVRKVAKRVLEHTCGFRVSEKMECVTISTPIETPKS